MFEFSLKKMSFYWSYTSLAVIFQSTSRTSLWWAYWTSHAPCCTVQSRRRRWIKGILLASFWSICATLSKRNNPSYQHCKYPNVSILQAQFAENAIYLILYFAVVEDHAGRRVYLEIGTSFDQVCFFPPNYRWIPKLGSGSGLTISFGLTNCST